MSYKNKFFAYLLIIIIFSIKCSSEKDTKLNQEMIDIYISNFSEFSDYFWPIYMGDDIEEKIFFSSVYAIKMYFDLELGNFKEEKKY